MFILKDNLLQARPPFTLVCYLFAFQQRIILAHDENAFERVSIMMEPKKNQQEINPAGFLVLTIKN